MSAGPARALAEKRNITEKDLFDFVWIGDPQVSPDGSRVAFVRVTVNEKKEGYNTSIWSVPLAGGEEPHQLTKGESRLQHRAGRLTGNFCFSSARLRKMANRSRPNCRSCRWRAAIHLSSPICRKAQESKLVARMAKGSPSRATQTPKTWRNRKRKKARRIEEGSEKSPRRQSRNAAAARGEDEHESDVRVITRAVYREDNEGYADPKHPAHIWLVRRRAVPTKKCSQASSLPADSMKERHLVEGRFADLFHLVPE